MGLLYFKTNKTIWKQKTLAVGIGRYITNDNELGLFMPYLCIGINLIFWYFTFGIRIGKQIE